MPTPTGLRHDYWFIALRRCTNRLTNKRRSAVRNLRFESLERRDLMTAVNMSPHDQLLLELINRARANPGVEASRYGIDLNSGLASGTISYDAKQPLAPNQMLQNAAGWHSDDMLANNYFSHTNLAGQSPSDRAAVAGYPTWVGENIAWGGTTGSVNQIQHVYQRHQNLFESPGHRQNMLSASYEEIGIGVRFGPYTHSNGVTYNSSMVTENFGHPGINPVITGVVYTDAADNSSNDDDFYSVGEQVTSGTIIATNTNSGVSYTTTIGTSGGFSLGVTAGTYNVVAASGVDGSEYLVSNVVVSNDNVKVDFETTTAAMANIAPTIEDLSDVILYFSQTDVNMTLAATDADGDTLVFSVTVENLAAYLDDSLGLTSTNSVYENWGGLGEKWLAGDDNLLYYITPSGQLFQWTTGGPGNLGGMLIASLDASYHQNTDLLYSATSGVSGATATVNGTDLSVVTDAQFDGTLVVTVTVSDGVDNDHTSLLVAKGNQFNRILDQSLGLYTDGDFREDWGGRQEKWLLGTGGLEYFITPDGQFFRHDGSPQNDLTGTFVAQLDADVHERPWLVYDADNHYLDVVLDRHTNDNFTSPPADSWLLYQPLIDRLHASRSPRGIERTTAESDARGDQSKLEGVSTSQSVIAHRSHFLLERFRSNSSSKSLTASEHDDGHPDRAPLTDWCRLADEAFACLESLGHSLRQ